jgi:hypothetical protein
VLRDSMALRISGVLGASHQHCFFVLQLDHIREKTHSIENKVLSTWATVATPSGASNCSSEHVSPKRALFCVVAKTGMLRTWPDKCCQTTAVGG